VVNARFVKPLDRELILDLSSRFTRILTVEDHVIQGGFGSAVLELLADARVWGVQVHRLCVPDRFISHGSQEELRHLCGIDEEGVTQAAIQMVQREKKKKQSHLQA
jgi:1-deoxy-D-xylulose-5-phosphate synthase